MTRIVEHTSLAEVISAVFASLAFRSYLDLGCTPIAPMRARVHVQFALVSVGTDVPNKALRCEIPKLWIICGPASEVST